MSGDLPVDCKMEGVKEGVSEKKATKASESSVAKKRGKWVAKYEELDRVEWKGWMGDFFLWTLLQSRYGAIYKSAVLWFVRLRALPLCDRQTLTIEGSEGRKKKKESKRVAGGLG